MDISLYIYNSIVVLQLTDIILKIFPGTETLVLCYAEWVVTYRNALICDEGK